MAILKEYMSTRNDLMKLTKSELISLILGETVIPDTPVKESVASSYKYLVSDDPHLTVQDEAFLEEADSPQEALRNILGEFYSPPNRMYVFKVASIPLVFEPAGWIQVTP